MEPIFNEPRARGPESLGRQILEALDHVDMLVIEKEDKPAVFTAMIAAKNPVSKTNGLSIRGRTLVIGASPFDAGWIASSSSADGIRVALLTPERLTHVRSWLDTVFVSRVDGQDLLAMVGPGRQKILICSAAKTRSSYLEIDVNASREQIISAFEEVRLIRSRLKKNKRLKAHAK